VVRPHVTNAPPREGRPLAKPPVRKLAKDLGVDLHAIAPGSGEGGVITREDVRAAAEGAPAAAVAAPGREAADGVTGFRGRAPGDVIPISGIRKRIVQKMVESRTTIPEATTSVTVDCTATWELAEKLTESAQAEGHEVRITPFAVAARATLIALRRFPTLNATIDEEAGEIRLLEPIHLGVAVDTDRGLLVPVIKDAHTRTTLGLAQEMTRLVRAARDGSIAPGDLTGGTFTVNNYGALRNDWGDPIINYPEAGILGIGAMNERPWVVDGDLAVRRVVTLTIAFDHRICDGGEAGRFIAMVGDLVENPGRIILHA
jgi:2-oxoisovalerate dehydrogenase E2 component (dihydrolipoyl transacylase)